MHRALLYRIVSEILQHNRTDLHVSDPGFVPDQSLSSHKGLLRACDGHALGYSRTV